MARNICVVGLGYVGLPLAVAFGKKNKIAGYDISARRVMELESGADCYCSISPEDLKSADIEYSSDPSIIKGHDFIVVAVPTPVNSQNKPDLSALESASRAVGNNMDRGSVVVYESTVYPGVTEDFCVPILEQESGLSCGIDFKVGYSPERVNPGDTEHTIENVVKIVSGMDPESLEEIAMVYESIISAGVYRSRSIKVAESAKVIENVQRDINIALMNELAIIFDRLDIPVYDVLKAAGTKWNFHHYTPGLVGGHCIGVDPYYLLCKAQEAGIHPQIITAGRSVNDDMHKYVSRKVIRELGKRDKPLKDSLVTVLGLTFKENVPDTRNSRVKHLIDDLKSYSVDVDAHDPMVSLEDALSEFDVPNRNLDDLRVADAVVIASPHDVFLEGAYSDYFKSLARNGSVVVDIKNRFRVPLIALPQGIIYVTL